MMIYITHSLMMMIYNTLSDDGKGNVAIHGSYAAGVNSYKYLVHV